ncbi:uncharacterized protein LOC116615363 [Nematostella vectensis]|uniref:uncharacterized protein LOC116615363 n=1 Tax=Nematostella vectensis TaxID=45351 RepID=UPI0020778F8E|nr:uncharacterized protein LOC116615363 [Nematostella vectensis]
MVKLNAEELKLLTDALFESNAREDQLEDVKTITEEKPDDEVMSLEGEVEETPDSHVQFPIRRRRSVRYRRLFCVGLFLVLFCGGLILAFCLPKPNYVLDIKLEKGRTLVYDIQQEMILQGPRIEKSEFSGRMTVQLVNRTANAHWLRFQFSSLPRFGNATCLIRVDLNRDKNMDFEKEQFEVYMDLERNPELDFYIHNLFNQIFPTLKLNLLDVIFSRVITRKREVSLGKSWYFPGEATMKQNINTDKEQIMITSHIHPKDFLEFSSPDHRLPNMKMKFKETAIISKQNGMIESSEMKVVAKMPIDGRFSTGSTISVTFTSSLRLNGNGVGPDASVEKNSTSFVKVPEPLSKNSESKMKFIPWESTGNNNNLIMEVKQLLNSTIPRKDGKESFSHKLSSAFHSVSHVDGVSLSLAEPKKKSMGQLKHDSMSNQSDKGGEEKSETKEKKKVDSDGDGPTVEEGKWKVERGDPPTDDEGDDDDDSDRADDDNKNDNNDETERMGDNEEDAADDDDDEEKQGKRDDKTFPPNTASPSTTKTTPTTPRPTPSASADKKKESGKKHGGIDWNPFHFFRNIWHHLKGDDKEKRPILTTSQPTTSPATKAPKHDSDAKYNEEEEDEWDPFGFFKNFWHADFEDENNVGINQGEDEGPLPPVFPVFRFPGFAERKKRSLVEPENKQKNKKSLESDISRKRRSLKEGPPSQYRTLIRDKRRLSDDGLDRDEGTTTGVDAAEVASVWDVVSDRRFGIKQHPCKSARVFKGSVHGIEVVGDLEHEVEAKWDVMDLKGRSDWSLRLKLGLEAGGHSFVVFERIYSRDEVKKIFLSGEKSKKEHGIIHGGTLVSCRPLFYIQQVCLEIRFDFSLHLSHIVSRLGKEYPVSLTMHTKHLAAVDALVTSHASTLINSAGVYTKGPLFQAKVPVDLHFHEASRPEWCAKASLRSRIGSFYRTWSAMNQWVCPLDKAVAMETTCAGLNKGVNPKEGKPLHDDDAFTKKLQVLDSC